MTYPTFRGSFIFLVLLSPLVAAPDGRELFQQNCAMCHGLEGLGQTGIFPPLASSDFLRKERERALAGVIEGLSAKIVVNGQSYQGAMPPSALDDDQLAAVFSLVFTSWGNREPPVNAAEIARVRATTSLPTIASAQALISGKALPPAPAGWRLTIGAELDFSPSRLALHPDGVHVLAISTRGDISQWAPGSPTVTRLFQGKDYIKKIDGETLVMGMTTDSRGRLYVTCNQSNLSVTPVRNDITIFRTEPWSSGLAWAKPSGWFSAINPYGIGPFNHGLSHIAQGPDGMLYVNSGARTDGGEAGTDPRYAVTGESPTTACLWRIDPDARVPKLEVFARGLRNTYGFCWDDQHRLIGTENGPDAPAPEELNFIEAGKHYGFPFVFSDWTKKPYPYTPERPPGLEFALPFKNLGPDAGGRPEGLSTFEPHSSPAGIVWLGADWPEPLANSFLVARFGNLVKLDRDVGFDVIQLRLDFSTRTLTTQRLLAPLGRPIDLLTLSGHRLVIAQHGLATTLAGGLGSHGRLLLLEPLRLPPTP